MFRISFVLGMLLLLLLCGCQQNTESELPKKLMLTGEEIQVDVFMELGNMDVQNNLLFIRRDWDADYAIRVFDLRDFSLISESISRGRGPGEVTNPAAGIIDEKNDIYWQTDWGKNCIHKFSIDSLLTIPNYKASVSFPINKSWIPPMNMFYHPSGHIGFTSVMLQKNLVSFMDLNGNLVDSLAIPNKVYPDTWKDMGYSDNPLICKYVPETNRMLIVSRHENKFSLIEMDGTPVWHVNINPKMPTISIEKCPVF